VSINPLKPAGAQGVCDHQCSCRQDANNIIFSFLVNNELYATGEFEKLDEADDEKEHSIELHLPYIAKVMER